MIRLVGVQLSIAIAIPSWTGVVSVSQEMTMNGGHVNVGEVLSSTRMFWVQEAENPHRSVAVQTLFKIPVPIQPFIWPVLSA